MRRHEDTQQTRTLRSWQRVVAWVFRFLARVELAFDRVFWGARKHVGRLGPLQVVSYRGFGTTQRATVRGRVLEASVLERSLPADTRLRNFRRMLRRFHSSEVPDIGVRAQVGTTGVDGRTDDEGYFELPVESPELGSFGHWKSAEVEVVDSPVRGLTKTRATAEILVPGLDTELGIISDIDDTVLQTHVTQKLKMIWVTAFGSPFTRMPFEGTSELYRALSAGPTGQASNPVFYVSKSPWNLYDFLVDFMDYHELPRGPLLLRDIGLREAPPLDHKSAAVQLLLETYPTLPFILIGDSGERDADIYLATAERYPGRIRAIYIRDLSVKLSAEAAKTRESQRALAARHGTEILWLPHAKIAQDHAKTHGWVR